MRYLNFSTKEPELFISAPIFEENNGTCTVWKKFKFIRDGEGWKDGSGSLFSINDDLKKLEVNRNRPQSYLNYQVKCQNCLMFITEIPSHIVSLNCKKFSDRYLTEKLVVFISIKWSMMIRSMIAS